MSEPETRTAQTVHGPVEYEVVQCDSCEQWCRKEDAERFYIADVDADVEEKGIPLAVFRNVFTHGWACPICREGGPIGFPGSGEDNDSGSKRHVTDEDVKLGWGLALIAPFIVPIHVALYLHPTEEHEPKWDLQGSGMIGMLLWVVIAQLLVLML